MKKLVINKANKRRIERWLKLFEYEQEKMCPFEDLVNQPCFTVCKKVFPKVVAKNGPIAWIGNAKCPCGLYSHQHVVRMAKRIVAGEFDEK